MCRAALLSWERGCRVHPVYSQQPLPPCPSSRSSCYWRDLLYRGQQLMSFSLKRLFQEQRPLFQEQQDPHPASGSGGLPRGQPGTCGIRASGHRPHLLKKDHFLSNWNGDISRDTQHRPLPTPSPQEVNEGLCVLPGSLRPHTGHFLLTPRSPGFKHTRRADFL